MNRLIFLRQSRMDLKLFKKKDGSYCRIWSLDVMNTAPPKKRIDLETLEP